MNKKRDIIRNKAAFEILGKETQKLNVIKYVLENL